MLRANYYGEHYDERGTINDPVSPTAEIDGIIYIDMEVSYYLSENLNLTLGGSNIFDEYVDEIGEGNANRLSVGLPYPRAHRQIMKEGLGTLEQTTSSNTVLPQAVRKKPSMQKMAFLLADRQIKMTS